MNAAEWDKFVKLASQARLEEDTEFMRLISRQVRRDVAFLASYLIDRTHARELPKKIAKGLIDNAIRKLNSRSVTTGIVRDMQEIFKNLISAVGDEPDPTKRCAIVSDLKGSEYIVTDVAREVYTMRLSEVIREGLADSRKVIRT